MFINLSSFFSGKLLINHVIMSVGCNIWKLRKDNKIVGSLRETNEDKEFLNLDCSHAAQGYSKSVSLLIAMFIRNK